MATAVTAILSILAVVVGALLQNYLARQSHQEKNLLDSRNAAYVDFLEAVSLVVAAQRMARRTWRLSGSPSSLMQRLASASLVRSKLLGA